MTADTAASGNSADDKTARPRSMRADATQEHKTAA